MASFYTEDRISIHALEDIVNRPHYEASVPPRKSLLRQVLAAYSFPRKIASCSVSDCYQNHKKGYLVRTSEGGECSICDSCANQLMDPNALKPPKTSRSRSGAAASTRTRASASQSVTQQIALETFASESVRIREQVKALKQMPRGANWLYQSLSNFQRACPQELFFALRELQTGTEESSVFERLIENNASDQQLQDVEQLEGLGIFTEDIRQLLIECIIKPLTQLDEKAKKTGPQEAITLPIDWNAQIEHNLVAAEKLIAEAQAFFTEENIKRLKSIPLTDNAAKAVRNLRWDCEKGEAKLR